MTPMTAQQHPMTAQEYPDARPASAALELVVLSGLHRGATLTLDHGDYAIGSALHAEIVLKDPGVTADHACLRIERGGVRIEATGGDVAIDDSIVRKGHGCRIRGPVEIMLGEARLCLRPLEVEPPGADLLTSRLGDIRKLLAHRPLGLVGAVACLMLVIGAAVVHVVRRPAGVEPATRLAFSGAIGDLRPLSAASDIRPVASLEQAVRDLNDRLDRASIRTLRVSSADGHIAVTGKLGKQQAAAWNTIQQWFDQAYRDFVLTAHVTVGDGHDMPGVQLQAIWYGDQPHIITGAGERAYQGAVLDNGWIVKEIGEERLLLSKDGETLVVTYW